MSKPLTIIIPTFKEPEYLDICLDSLYKTQKNENHVIVIIDGHINLNQKIIDKYSNKPNFQALGFKENKGLAYSLNIGVQHAKTEHVLIINDDNVFPEYWDERLYKHLNDKKDHSFFIVPNQIEPIMFADLFAHLYILKDLGMSHKDFDFNKFINYEKEIRFNKMTEMGWTFPFAIKKEDYMKVGGWDLSYNSPHVVDLDFFYKLKLNNFKSYRVHDIHFYHFSGKSTINSDNNDRQQIHDYYRQKEYLAIQHFIKKWGFPPIRKPDNSI